MSQRPSQTSTSHTKVDSHRQTGTRTRHTQRRRDDGLHWVRTGRPAPGTDAPRHTGAAKHHKDPHMPQSKAPNTQTPTPQTKIHADTTATCRGTHSHNTQTFHKWATKNTHRYQHHIHGYTDTHITHRHTDTRHTLPWMHVSHARIYTDTQQTCERHVCHKPEHTHNTHIHRYIKDTHPSHKPTLDSPEHTDTCHIPRYTSTLTTHTWI